MCVWFVLVFCLVLLMLIPACHSEETAVSDNSYQGDLVSFPAQWSFMLGKSAIILVSDEELVNLADPDKLINPKNPGKGTLREICERARASGHRTLIVAFDYFFAQYEPGQHEPRKLTPDRDEYVTLIGKVSEFASQYGLGLELSLLSPLEVGPAYRAQTGESGLWMHYRKGLRDPKTGKYSVQLWQQKRWANNKGIIEIEDAGVRVFAFRESKIPGTPYRVVDPKAIVELSKSAQVETIADKGEARRIRVYGEGNAEIGELDRVLVVQQYRTPEMDYFSDGALPFLKGLVDKYVDAGVKLNGLYSDEMHIQQDWDYFGHHDNGEFAVRYVSAGFCRKFAERYGAEYRDFAKYLVYFCYGQEDYSTNLDAKEGVMHVFGPSPEDIRRTALFRARYYHFLQDGVVDLFVSAKKYAEQRAGHRLEARAHATWAESPTIDYWRTGQENHYRSAYEYTSNFVWSNTVHQAASACYDYFKWGEFLTGNGNDHAECGWADRNYVGLALACSTGIVNDIPYSYGAHWGMPDELSRRRSYVQSAFGASGSPLAGIVQDMQHRDVDVLMLYPMDLVAVEERFGSWMTQYAYANSITQAKLLELGTIADGAIDLRGRRFRTLVVTFEPFPSGRLLTFMTRFVKNGGRLVWSGPPPVLTAEGTDALQAWQNLFGVDYTPSQDEGKMAPGQQVVFEGVLSSVSPQTILTDFLVDRVYPVTPRQGVSVVARVKSSVVGTHRLYANGGTAVFLGYRPRDDQSGSLGYESRNWFDVLSALGAYPPTGRFPGINDNTEHISRVTKYVACRFPNGAIAIAPHFKDVEEDWPGGFIRNREDDERYLKDHPVPSDELYLRNFAVNGHKVGYRGRGCLVFRTDQQRGLVAFSGNDCREIVVDGKRYVFSTTDLSALAFAPIPKERRVENGAVMQVMVHGTGRVKIPICEISTPVELVVEGTAPGSRGETVPCTAEGQSLVFDVTDRCSGKWLYVIPRTMQR